MVKSEIARKSNPHNLQGSSSKGIIPQANKTQRNVEKRLRKKVAQLSGVRKPKKKGKCYYCGKPGHFKNVCRKWIKDKGNGKNSGCKNNHHRNGNQNQN